MSTVEYGDCMYCGAPESSCNCEQKRCEEAQFDDELDSDYDEGGFDV